MLLKKLLCSGDYTTSRVEAFSDGVFAIIVTLLALDLHTPLLSSRSNLALWQALLALAPKIIIYVIGFLNIAVYWINHHQLFSSLKRTDRGFLWLNCLLLLLLILAFMPFPTSVVGEYPDSLVAIAFFGVVMMFAALCFGTMRAYATYYGCLIDCSRAEHTAVRQSVIKSYLGAGLYLIAILLGFVSTYLSIVLYFLIPLICALPGRLEVD